MDRLAEKLRNDFWIEDAKNGGIIRKQYEQIKFVLSQKNMDWVYQRYDEIKHYAIVHTEFYKSYSIDDEFPVVNKLSLMRNYQLHLSDEHFEEPLHVSSTSGSTGTPFSVYQDFSKRKRTIADLKVFGERCNYPSHECMLFFRGTTKSRTREQEEKENIFYIDCGNLGNASLEKMLQEIIHKKPRIIFSYSSTLIELAKFIASQNIKYKFSMKSALVAGEGLSDTNRLFLEKIFGCKVYRRYSDMELGILGQDMGDGASII